MSDQFRVVAWNCRRASLGSAAWDYLLELNPDVALLQETGLIPDRVAAAYETAIATPVTDSGKPQGFRTAVMVKGTILGELELRVPVEWVARELEFFRGNFVAKRAVLHNGFKLDLISVYSPAFPIDKSRLAGVDTSGIQLIHNRDVWATEILWACLSSMAIRETDCLIVGGDFNSSETFDTMWGKSPRGNLEIIERMDALGLRDCLRSFQGKLTPTFRSSNGTIIHQIDHMYATRAMLNRLIRCHVGSADRVFGTRPYLSDHLPIVADFGMHESAQSPSTA
jgi:exonuclease III